MSDGMQTGGDSLVRSVQVQFTIDVATQGEAIVVDLLSKRLVACAQTLGPVTSRYWWQGSITEAREWLFLCKTTPERLHDVLACLRPAHPDAGPETRAWATPGGLDAPRPWSVADSRTT